MLDLDPIEGRLKDATPADKWTGWPTQVGEDGEIGWAASGPLHPPSEDDDGNDISQIRAAYDQCVIDNAPADIAALIAEVKRLREALSKPRLLKIIRNWKYHWMSKEGEIYRARACQIDANMAHHLAELTANLSFSADEVTRGAE